MQTQIFDLIPSKLYQRYVVTILILSSVVVLLIPVHLIVKIVLFTLIVVYGLCLLYRNSFIKRLSYTEGGTWILETQNRTFEGVLRGDSLVTSFMSLLYFRIPDHYLTKSCIVFKDSLHKDQYRQLVVLLRMY